MPASAPSRGLTVIFRAIEELLTPAILAAGGRPPSYVDGANTRHRGDVPPKITWVPMGGPVSGKGLGAATGGNPQALAIRKHTFQARIWGEDIDATSILMNHVVAAAHASAGSAKRIVHEAWDTEGDLKLGQLAILTFEVDIPFTAEPSPTVEPTAVDLTGEFQAP